MKPFMKYPGGKAKELPLILKNIPCKINRYFEPFVGGGSVYFGLGIKESYINDFSKDLMNLYLLIKEKNSELQLILNKFDEIWLYLNSNDLNVSIIKGIDIFDINDYLNFYESSISRKKKVIERLEEAGNVIDNDNIGEIHITARKTAFYMMVRKAYNLTTNQYSPLRAATYYFLREYCYSSMFRFSKNGDFNVPYGGMSYNNKFMTSKIEYMFSKSMSDFLELTMMYNLDFEVFLNKFILNEDDFIFLDPPYDSEFSTYDQNSFDKNEQIRLKSFLSNTKAKWMLVIKKTNFIYDLYKEYNIYEYDKNYMVSFKNRNNKDVEHLLITNYKI